MEYEEGMSSNREHPLYPLPLDDTTVMWQWGGRAVSCLAMRHFCMKFPLFSTFYCVRERGIHILSTTLFKERKGRSKGRRKESRAGREGGRETLSYYVLININVFGCKWFQLRSSKYGWAGGLLTKEPTLEGGWGRISRLSVPFTRPCAYFLANMCSKSGRRTLARNLLYD